MAPDHLPGIERHEHRALCGLHQTQCAVVAQGQIVGIGDVGDGVGLAVAEAEHLETVRHAPDCDRGIQVAGDGARVGGAVLDRPEGIGGPARKVVGALRRPVGHDHALSEHRQATHMRGAGRAVFGPGAGRVVALHCRGAVGAGLRGRYEKRTVRREVDRLDHTRCAVGFARASPASSSAAQSCRSRAPANDHPAKRRDRSRRTASRWCGSAARDRGGTATRCSSRARSSPGCHPRRCPGSPSSGAAAEWCGQSARRGLRRSRRQTARSGVLRRRCAAPASPRVARIFGSIPAGSSLVQVGRPASGWCR